MYPTGFFFLPLFQVRLKAFFRLQYVIITSTADSIVNAVKHPQIVMNKILQIITVIHEVLRTQVEN